mmetsp:Transcript_12537/g.10764  ORF Transcript_12537/g.10764 Transcript_12537/m.10764 type:complete len:206 (-) Transcript_12537:378-995(-)|eukprot:CAMPEP_0114589652 /NCGR_PEP_ID=MMETSP0125-20121206/12053_1 /TAXON_ID=485358 ORGANISM="Aristerostoma sp., Strain ATCC 50986" /NCGR_SAMPLE_ID=MMETSP0125 /ASSEMBLY_ACC=CAM_ASM_000245 /LENGTH=205 /DNA_ID=CAMNT_0001786659 /DNA_START=174 /DNA_END=791 /DNA_ORIENTATION=-
MQKSNKPLEIKRLISKEKYSVYEAYSHKKGMPVAVKCYPLQKNKGIDPFFTNEKNMLDLKHKNVIDMIQAVDKVTLHHDNSDVEGSVIVMELAPYGDIIDVFNNKAVAADEKLARTYFHQLVSGVEFLHTNKVAHLDLKLENILVGKDYQLKIIDFDLCGVIGQKENFGKGTMNYRAPEVAKGFYNDFVKADIYSMAIVLFFLKF